MIMARKRAKTLTPQQYEKLLAYVQRHSRTPERDKLFLALSFRAGLRAGEIAKLRMESLLDPSGKVGKCMTVFADTSKSRHDRTIPVHPELKAAIDAFRAVYPYLEFVALPSYAKGEQSQMSPNALVQWFRRLYAEAGFGGCSSHSGRRTCITELAKRANRFHNSLHDVQQIAGHRRLETTQSYIEPSEDTFDMVASLGQEHRWRAGNRARQPMMHMPKPHEMNGAKQARRWPRPY
jgi:integrase/recombinase XerD